MKAVKLGVFAMALGLFAASCGTATETTEEAPATEVITEETTTSEVVPGTDSVVETTTTTTESVDTVQH